MRLIIAPWEYRHLRAWARVRIACSAVLIGLALVTLGFGGDDRKTYGFALLFVAVAGAQLAFASWLLRIARSPAAGA